MKLYSWPSASQPKGLTFTSSVSSTGLQTGRQGLLSGSTPPAAKVRITAARLTLNFQGLPNARSLAPLADQINPACKSACTIPSHHVGALGHFQLFDVPQGAPTPMPPTVAQPPPTLATTTNKMPAPSNYCSSVTAIHCTIPSRPAPAGAGLGGTEPPCAAIG